MEEHPIPQEVSTYEFRLVGDMTIKQFLQVAAGALIALVLYSTQIAPYVKWPLIIISFLSGIALAFFPIEDRPLSKWIVLFVKAIYSPTIYVWDKNARKYDFFQPEAIETPQVATAGVATTVAPVYPPQPQTAVPQADDGQGNLEKKEQEFLSKVNSEFATQSPVTGMIPSLTGQQKGPVEAKTVNESNIKIPETTNVKVGAQAKELHAPESPKIQNTMTTGKQVTPIATQKLDDAKAAIFSQEASPPSPPTKPNVIVGQVLSSDGKIIDAAILEIKDSDGRPVRALRSNRLGHFMIVTPLANGKYRITTEKEGFNFDPVTFEAKDQIIPPIAIWAKT